MIRALFKRLCGTTVEPVLAAKPMIESAATVSPRDVGLHDAIHDGWFLGDSGELLKGFAIDAATPA